MKKSFLLVLAMIFIITTLSFSVELFLIRGDTAISHNGFSLQNDTQYVEAITFTQYGNQGQDSEAGYLSRFNTPITIKPYSWSQSSTRNVWSSSNDIFTEIGIEISVAHNSFYSEPLFFSAGTAYEYAGFTGSENAYEKIGLSYFGKIFNLTITPGKYRWGGHSNFATLELTPN